MKKLSNAKAILIALMCLFTFNMWGQVTITDEASLRAISNDLAGDYVLANDITLTAEWEPIGTNDAPFTGTIDGKGHTIYGLEVNQASSKDNMGFIGVAKNDDAASTKLTVKSLNFVGAEVYGKNDVGIVIGNSYGAKVSECYTSGVVFGEDHVGGIIGGSKAVGDTGATTKISNCFSNAAVVSKWHQSGGILGASVNTEIANCYFSGTAICSSSRTGGIVGLNDSGTLSINNCVVLSAYLKSGSGDWGACNAILGSDNGDAVSTITNCYSWDGTKLYESDEEKIRENNAANSYDGEYKTLAELQQASFWTNTVSFDNSIWNTSAKYPMLKGVAAPMENGLYFTVNFPERCLPGKTSSVSVYAASSQAITYSSSNPSVATIDETGAVTFVADGTTTLTFAVAADDLMKANEKSYELEVKSLSYTIMDESDLRNIVYDLDGDYTLGANIQVTGDWNPISEFTGSLNGNGYTISGIHYDNEGSARVGLFGTTRGAEIKQLGLVGAYIKGKEDVGAIIGYSYGSTVTECYVDQSSYISGRDHVAAIIGCLDQYENEEGAVIVTNLRDSYASSDVYSREYQAGGVAGAVKGAVIERCYFSGRVIAEKGTAGGVFSIIDTDNVNIVKNTVCLASGIYNTSENSYCIGGSLRDNTTCESNYVDYYASYKGSSITNSSATDSSDAASTNGETLYDNQVLSSAFYKGIGWDFDNVWSFPEGAEGSAYPILKSQKNKQVTPYLYGLENGLYLEQTSAGTAVSDINLEKIKSTSGQKLAFEVTKGGDYVFIYEDGASYLAFCDFLGDENKAIVSIAPAAGSVAGIASIEPSEFEVLLVGNSTVFSINTLEEFLAIENLLFANYRLEADIDMTDVHFEGFGSAANPYTGTFDGNGYSIINPSLTTNGANVRGIFNKTEGATIKNLGVVNFSRADATVHSSSDMGSLIGAASQTTIDQCYVTGKVEGHDHVGGLIGGQCSNVTITNTFVNVYVKGYSQLGGFTGTVTGNTTFKNCYFAGSVNGNPGWCYGWAGGYIGLVDTDEITINIENCVAVGDVAGPNHAAWFIGGNGTDTSNPRATIKFTGNVINYDANIATVNESENNSWDIAGYPTLGDVTPSTPEEYYMIPTNEFLTELPYEAASFDFDAIWTIEADKNDGYPILKNVAFKTEKDGTDVEQISAPSYKIATSDNAIIVKGIKDNARVEVYTIAGQLVKMVNTNADAQIEIAANGIYVVRVVENASASVSKVIVR